MSRPTFLTTDEHAAMALTAELANTVRKIIGYGPDAQHDWNEAAVRIHGVQHMILAQAAARAYPDEYRLLGQSFANPGAPAEDPDVAGAAAVQEEPDR